jgi:hypothetical protein
VFTFDSDGSDDSGDGDDGSDEDRWKAGSPKRRRSVSAHAHADDDVLLMHSLDPPFVFACGDCQVGSITLSFVNHYLPVH